jgi:hypothetical protein
LIALGCKIKAAWLERFISGMKLNGLTILKSNCNLYFQVSQDHLLNPFSPSHFWSSSPTVFTLLTLKEKNWSSVFFIFECCILLCLSILILYGAVNHNCFFIYSSFDILTFLFNLHTHYMFRPLWATLRWNVQFLFWGTISTTTDPLYVCSLIYRLRQKHSQI